MTKIHMRDMTDCRIKNQILNKDAGQYVVNYELPTLSIIKGFNYSSASTTDVANGFFVSNIFVHKLWSVLWARKAKNGNLIMLVKRKI